MKFKVCFRLLWRRVPDDHAAVKELGAAVVTVTMVLWATLLGAYVTISDTDSDKYEPLVLLLTLSILLFTAAAILQVQQIRSPKKWQRALWLSFKALMWATTVTLASIAGYVWGDFLVGKLPKVLAAKAELNCTNERLQDMQEAVARSREYRRDLLRCRETAGASRLSIDLALSEKRIDAAQHKDLTERSQKLCEPIQAAIDELSKARDEVYRRNCKGK